MQKTTAFCAAACLFISLLTWSSSATGYAQRAVPKPISDSTTPKPVPDGAAPKPISDSAAPTSIPDSAATATQLYLPIAQRYHPRLNIPAKLGARLAHFESNQPPWTPYLVRDAVYELEVRWYQVETSPGVYNWSNLDTALLALTGHTDQLIVGVKAAPSWAREWPEYVSSRPRRDYWEAYAHFINLVIERTGAWGVEIWNEPAQPCYSGILDYYGCWLPATQGRPTMFMFYDGGVNYSQMLKTIIPIIKSAHPQVKVIVGAISGYIKDGEQAQFVLGMRRTGLGGADYFSYHIYMKSDNIKDLPVAYFDFTFEATGRLSADTGLPIIVSETAVRTALINDDTAPPSAQFLEDQNEYLERLIETSPAHPEVHAILWYTLAGCGYENTDLIYNRGVGNEKYKQVYCTWATALGHPEVCPLR